MNTNVDFNSVIIGPGSGHPWGCNCYLCKPVIWPFAEYKGPEVDWRCDLELPGVKKSAISVKMKGGTVTVTWTNRLGQLLNQPYHIGDKYYDMSKLSVKYEDGLLRIHCPLKPEFPPVPPEEPEIDIEIK